MTAFSSDLIDFEMRGNIAVLTLNRPEKRNAVNETLIQDINRFFSTPPKEAVVVVLRARRAAGYLPTMDPVGVLARDRAIDRAASRCSV